MSSVAATGTASDIQMDYMTLLVTQLRNQNPLEPLDNNEMAAQLAQFSQLQQLESMNSSFSEVLAGIERTYANSLIGKEVSFVPDGASDSGDIASGIVGEVYNNVDGEIIVVAGDYMVALGNIISVKN